MSDNLESLESARIDKWLWAVRICKTRSLAQDYCKRQRVSINDQFVKPSRSVHIGQIVTLKKDGVQWTYKVLKCIEKRVSAPLAAQCKEDMTDPDELAKLKTIKSARPPQREQGSGRPTKKERRALDKLMDNSSE